MFLTLILPGLWIILQTAMIFREVGLKIEDPVSESKMYQI